MHSKVVSLLTTISLVTNLTIYLFSDSRMEVIDPSWRFLFIFLTENVLFIGLIFLNMGNMPNWFKIRDRLKFSYQNWCSNNEYLVKEQEKKEINSARSKN